MRRRRILTPLGIDLLSAVKAPTLVLTQPGDPLHPLRSGDILHELMPEADLCVAPTATFWHEYVEETADVIAAFVEGRCAVTARFAAARACTFKARKDGR